MVYLKKCYNVRVEIRYARLSIMASNLEAPAANKPPESSFVFDEVANHLRKINASILLNELNNSRNHLASFITYL